MHILYRELVDVFTADRAKQEYISIGIKPQTRGQISTDTVLIKANTRQRSKPANEVFSRVFRSMLVFAHPHFATRKQHDADE
jgi:hypothetical protein